MKKYLIFLSLIMIFVANKTTFANIKNNNRTEVILKDQQINSEKIKSEYIESEELKIKHDGLID